MGRRWGGKAAAAVMEGSTLACVTVTEVLHPPLKVTRKASGGGCA